MKNNLLKEGVKAYNKLKLNIKKNIDPDFNTFLSFPQEQNLENINSKEKLEYLKLIDLSKQGFIDPDRKKYFEMEKELYKLMDIDQNVKLSGQISISQGEKYIKTLFVGYDTKDDKIMVSDSFFKDIPVWKKPSFSEIKNLFGNVNPQGQDLSDKKLSFKHEFFESDVEGLPKTSVDKLEKQFNKIAETAFESNKYIQKNYPALPDDFALNNFKYKDQNFKIPSSLFLFSDTGSSDFIVGKFNNYLNGQYSFEPIIKSGNEKIISTNKEMLDDHINSRYYELIGKLDDKIAIGVKKADNSPQIGVKDGVGGYVWKPYADLKFNPHLNDSQKAMVKETLTSKDFLVEQNKVELKNPADPTEKLIVQKHFNKPGLYFTETNKTQEHSIKNFKEMTSEKAIEIGKKYKANPEVKNFKKMVEKEGLMDKMSNAKEVWKEITKAASYAVHRV